MTRDTSVALGLIVVAGLYWLGADQIRISKLEGIVGAQAVPKGLAIGLAVLSVLLIGQQLARPRRAAAPDGEIEAGGARAHLRAAGMLLIGMGYLAVIGSIGYMPSVALLVLVSALYLGQSLSVRLVLVAVGLAVLYDLLFVRLLGIPLPAGIWPAAWRALAG
ncbi:MAG TPA: tripartite tricarboxylate transporter TctB family protein [Geminicoccaceae bacterium]|nr:tripartite tricarboxylate transporter TctB family protein [Geminicoccaceae bacterium]